MEKHWQKKSNVLEKRKHFFEAVKSRIVIKDSIWEIKEFGGKEQRYISYSREVDRCNSQKMIDDHKRSWYL